MGITGTASRLADGDYLGALGELSAAGLGFIPGLGTAASLGIQTLLEMRDESLAEEDPYSTNQYANGGVIPKFGIGGFASKLAIGAGKTILGIGKAAAYAGAGAGIGTGLAAYGIGKAYSRSYKLLNKLKRLNPSLYKQVLGGYISLQTALAYAGYNAYES